MLFTIVNAQEISVDYPAETNFDSVGAKESARTAAPACASGMASTKDSCGEKYLTTPAASPDINN